MTLSPIASHRVPTLSRRELLRRGSLLVGGALAGSALLSRGLAQAAPAALPENSVENENHPIAQMRQSMAQAPIGTTRVGDRHVVFTGAGGNIGLYLGDEGLVAIDSGSGREPSTQRLREAIEAVSDKSLRYLVNTHWHFDHTDGNANLHGLGATIVAHRAVRTRLSSPQVIAFFNAAFPKSGRDALPTLTFEHPIELDLGNDVLRLVPVTPAHTDSDTIVIFPASNVIQTGDLYFAGSFPFIDSSSGGSLEGMIRATETILAATKPDTTLIPGHGPVSTPKDLAATLEMLRTVRDRLAPFQQQGRTLEEVLAAKPLADLDATWNTGFLGAEAFTRIVYPSKA